MVMPFAKHGATRKMQKLGKKHRLGSSEQGSNYMLARDIISLALYFHEGLGISVVIIGQLLRRQPWASPRDLNQKIVGTNQLLKEKCDIQERIYFWFHRGLGIT